MTMESNHNSLSMQQEVFSNSSNGLLWQDGWYLYANEEVSGPFTANELFIKRSPHAKDHSLVSRKGFSSWYDYGKVQQLYSSDKQNQGNRILQLKDRFTSRLRSIRQMKTPSQRQQVSSEVKQTKKQGLEQTTKKRKANRKKVQKRAKVVGKNYASSNRQQKEASKQKPKSILPAYSARPKTENQTAPQIPSEPKVVQKSLAYHHLTLKGRLRLGRISNPWMLSIIKFPLSLGWYWKTWFETAVTECTYHLDDPYAQEKMKRSWKALIPGWHVVMVYRLAKLVLEMEVQNHYRRTSLFTAILTSFFPPLTILYLQNRMNHHWTLHVKHAVSTQLPNKKQG